MHDIVVVDTVRRHAVPVDLESAAQRVLEPIDPHVSLVLIGEAVVEQLVDQLLPHLRERREGSC